MWYVVVGDRVIPVPCERDEDANFLNKSWWENATPKDVEAEIKKGADVNAHEKVPLLLSEKELEKYQNQKKIFDNFDAASPDYPMINALKNLNESQEKLRINSLNTPIMNALRRGFDDARKVFNKKCDLCLFEKDEQLSPQKIKAIVEKFDCSETLEDVKKTKEELLRELKKAEERQKVSENIISILIKHGASLDKVVRIYYNDLISESVLNILDILIEAGLDVNEQIFDFQKAGMINLAARYGKKKVDKRLLDAGAKDTRSFMEKIKTHIG